MSVKPKFAEALHLLGMALANQGQLDEAAARFEQVLLCRPDDPDALGELGLVQLRQGKNNEAIDCLQRSLRHKADIADYWFHLACACRRVNDLDRSLAACREALRLRPDWPEVHLERGMCLVRQGKTVEAMEAYQEALRINPRFSEAHNNRGVLLEDQGKYADAIAHFRQAIQLNPQSTEGHSNLGVALAALNQFDEAIACYREALRLRCDSAEAHNNLGNALRALGRFEEAMAHFREALRIRPDYAEAFNNLGIVLVYQGQVDEGAACYNRALELKPDYADAHLNRSLVWLAVGDWARGWKEYEWRWKGKKLQPERNFPEPRWDGTSLAGKTLLLYAEQGLGDTLQFVRYAPLLQQRGARVVFECPKSLLKILARTPGIDQVVEQGQALPPFDFHAPLLNLPALLGTTLNSVPVSIPYVFPDPEAVERWRRELAGMKGFRVGIAWQGNPQYRNDRHRSVPLAHFAVLGKIPGVTLISLQKGPGTDQLEAAAGKFEVHDLGRRLDEEAGPFMDTAAVMKNLDLVITSDTAIPHLAGALGVPVWMATPFSPDWRWLREREDCPWYPTMRLFREPALGSWDVVFRRIADELNKCLAEPHHKAARPRMQAETSDYRHGLALLKQGRLAEAVRFLEQVVATQPAHAEALHNLGVARARQGNLEQAVARFQQVLELLPDSPEAHGNLGLAYLRLEQLSKARDHLREAVRLLPGSAQTHNHLGVVLAKMGRDMEARAAYEEALRIRPDFAAAISNLALLSSVPHSRSAALEPLSNPVANSAPAIMVRVSPGELIDKITILEIKSERLTEAMKLRNVRTELTELHAARDRIVAPNGELGRLSTELKAINESLWKIEDDIRICERNQDFGAAFTRLARSVYQHNDRRAGLKREINLLLGSQLVEEKSYASYRMPTPA